jgi:hypothetical protein
MKRLSLASQTVRTFIAAAALAVGAVGCGGGDSNNTGAAGSGGAGTGGAGTGGSCDAMALFKTKYSCSLNSACHDAQGSAAKFDMASDGWETHLVGQVPKGGGTIASMCATGANATRPYLVAGSNPATGLFMDKFKTIPPCGETMPMLTGPVSAADMACIQQWATALTTK